MKKTHPLTATSSLSATTTYDRLNRIRTRSYAGGVSTPSVTYCYDGITSASGCAASPSGAFSPGRLTMAQNSIGGAIVSTTQYLGFDGLGRVTASQQVTGAGGIPVTTFGFAYQYNAVGMTTETYPSLRSVVTSYDNAGRVAGVQNQASSGTLTPYASGIAYAANNAVNSLTLGNGILESTAKHQKPQEV